MNAGQVKEAYEALNGKEAAEEVSSVLYEHTAEYANLNGYEDPADVLMALDVLRLVADGHFD